MSVPTLTDLEPEDEADALWSQYRIHREEAAFHAIVRRYLPAVAAAARRLVNGDAALAEDICQEVFTHLAVHAAKLPPRVVLGGWLHRHTCFTAAKTLRAAVRRRSREQVAAADAVMHTSHPSHSFPASPESGPGTGSGLISGAEFSSGSWAELAPHLDAALNRLPAGDRDAVVLRFFEKRGIPAMAAALNISEDAARMRTNRALEKLRRLLGRHQPAGRGSGAALTVAVLASLLRENSVASLPTGVAGPAAADAASRVAAAALGKASAALSPAAAVGAGAGVVVGFRTWLVSQKAALLGSGALIAAAGAVWWFNHRLDSAGMGGGGSTAAAVLSMKPGIPGKGGAAAGGKQVNITVDYLLVPEAQALSLLNQRWNGDGDTELRAALLKQSGGPPGGSAGSGAEGGVRLAKSLTGTFVSGVPQTLEDAVTVKSPVAKVNPPPPGVVRRNGPEGNPDGFELRKVGTLAELNATVSDDGEWGSVKLRSTHHFAKPQTIQWSADPPGGSGSAAAPEDNAGRRMEFRGATADLYSVQRIGSSSLIQSSQLPAAPDAAADGGPGGGAVTSSGYPVWLFTFVTLEPASSLP